MVRVRNEEVLERVVITFIHWSCEEEQDVAVVLLKQTHRIIIKSVFNFYKEESSTSTVFLLQRMSACWSLVCVCLLIWSHTATSYGTCNGKKMIRSGGLTCEDKEAIVHEHNRLRQSVALGKVSGQPSASNMLQMEWDDGLAATAQRWADHCTIAHDLARSDRRFTVGQNVAATWTTRSSVSPAPDFEREINKWFNEVRYYHYATSGFSLSTGHYTQLIWSDTYLVGCGYSFYYDRSKGYTKLYVCNYGPGGNIIGDKPYRSESSSCSSQGLKDSSQYKGLCAMNEPSSTISGCAASGIKHYSSRSISSAPYTSAILFHYNK